MKKIIILILITVIIKMYIPKYNELNNVIIIDKIIINCNKKNNITLREKYITKDGNDLKYKYKYYKIKTNDLNDINNLFKKNYHKNLYLKKAKIKNKC